MTPQAIYAAVRSQPDAYAPELAAQLGVSERTVYRHRKRNHYPPTIRKHDHAAMAAWVKARKGDVKALAFANHFGIGRDTAYGYRKTMIVRKMIEADDWPLNNGRLPKGREYLVLKAMIQAGATPSEIAGAFRIHTNMAGRWIRDCWVLMELEAA